MRRWALVTGVGLVGVVCCGAGLAARPAGRPMGGMLANSPLGRLVTGHAGRLADLRTKLGLSDEQVQQIRGVVASHRAEIAQVVKPAIEKRRALVDLVRADQTDETAIREAADGLGKAIGNGAVMAAKVRKEIRPILTPQQQQMMEDFRADTRQSVDQWLTEFGQEPKGE